jgi:hypothetical protein
MVQIIQIIQIEDCLLEKIEVKKKRLMKFASQFELTNYRVVECSQELDELLNQFQSRVNLHHSSQTETELIGKEGA